jgi:hypothetical protein
MCSSDRALVPPSTSASTARTPSSTCAHDSAPWWPAWFGRSEYGTFDLYFNKQLGARMVHQMSSTKSASEQRGGASPACARAVLVFWLTAVHHVRLHTEDLAGGPPAAV